jgi:hypothetical protein
MKSNVSGHKIYNIISSLLEERYYAMPANIIMKKQIQSLSKPIYSRRRTPR